MLQRKLLALGYGSGILALLAKKVGMIILLWFLAAGFLSAYIQTQFDKPIQQIELSAETREIPVSSAELQADPRQPSVPEVSPIQAVVPDIPDSENSVWDKLAMCESSGDWSIDTGNGYYGGLQFMLSSWQMVGGTGYPHQATKEEQIARAEVLKTRQGWEAWPDCSSKLGLR